jgi:serine/threonine protein kinase
MALRSSGPAGWAVPPSSPDEPEPGRRDSSDISRLIDMMTAAWARGQPIRAEEMLARNPELGEESVIRLIYEETCLHRESGQEVRTSEVLGRFPRWKDQLEVLLGCDRLLRPMSQIAVLPEPGENLGPFRLLAELGRGASGKTYLAAEPALADRLVVLKVISDDQEEHLSLARLQHTYIIPLFSEHAFPERGLRALCMPYLGGTSLSRILEALAEVPPVGRRGQHILDVLDRVEAGRPVPMQPDGPYRRYLQQASYVQAICWIGACLADALQDAHARGLVHMDVKPSNVLIAADGTPMLLDFHLARKPIQASERFPDRIGGTRGWMAPEHGAALEAVGRGQPVPGPVDYRADLYALGLLLREGLGGPSLGHRYENGPPLRRRNPSVGVGLEAIVEKCLAERPSGRYGNAAALAADLRRQINDLPLRGVRNRLTERVHKWQKRNPAGPLGVAGLLILIAAGAVGALFYYQRVHELQTALDDGRAFCNSGQYPDAVHTLARGRERALGVPGIESLARALTEQLREARRGEDAATLHQLAERVRFEYGIDPPAKAGALFRDIQAIWDRRHQLLPPPSSGHDSSLDQRIRTDLLELVGVWAELRIRLTPPAESRNSRDQILHLLDEARTSCGPSFTIDRLIRLLAGEQGPTAPTREPGPVAQSASEHYDLGRSDLRSGEFARAAEEFRLALDRRPQDFWPNFYAGHCAYRLGRYSEAFASFSVCIALAPQSAPSYFNRALAAEACGRTDQAFRDYTHALGLEPRLTKALLNRGILSYKSNHYPDAIADLGHALDTASDPDTLGRVHFNLALAYLAHGDRSLARASAEKAIDNGNDDARRLRDQLGRER